MSGTMMVAIAGLAVSGALAALRIWEAFFLTADIKVNFDWFQAANGNALIWFVANVGRVRRKRRTAEGHREGGSISR
jgi:hypothetical protein